MPTHYKDKKVPGTRTKKLNARPAARPEIDGSKMLQAVLDVPELETMDEPDRPEFDRRRAKHLEYAAAAALLGAGLGAATDLPLTTQLMSGMSSGYSTGLHTMNEDYATQLGAYQERLFDTRKLNTGIANEGAKMQQGAQEKAADLQNEIARINETKAHNEAQEVNAAAQTDLKAESQGETERHNREMEDVADKRADNDRRREDRLAEEEDPLSLTGRYLAAQQIDNAVAQIESRIAELSKTKGDAIINRDRIKELEDQRGQLTRQKYSIMAGMKNADLNQFLGEGKPAREPANPRSPVPGGPLDRFVRQATGQEPQLGPVPSEPGAEAKKKSKYGLEDLF